MENEISRVIAQTAETLTENYKHQQLFEVAVGEKIPSRDNIIRLIGDLRNLTFPGYFNAQNMAYVNKRDFAGSLLSQIYDTLYHEIRVALWYGHRDLNYDCVKQKAEDEALAFINQIPEIQRLIMTDVEAEYSGDPAAKSKQEVIISYPGLYAIFVYRYAHALYLQDIPFIPRIMSEHAHGKTGIDINPGATIGEYFFIDHGTGIVIGETTKIGNHVKIYQGVTLGALSTRKGHLLSGVKRHPTIEDNVVIYSNTTVLGGDTVIGANSVIAGNTFITHSIAANTKVSSVAPDLEMKENGQKLQTQAGK